MFADRPGTRRGWGGGGGRLGRAASAQGFPTGLEASHAAEISEGQAGLSSCCQKTRPRRSWVSWGGGRLPVQDGNGGNGYYYGCTV